MELYLSSDEYKDFKEVRKILEYHKIVIDDRNLLIVKVDIPLIGQKYGWGAKDIGTLYITNRFIDDRSLLEKLDKFPIHIHICLLYTSRCV